MTTECGHASLRFRASRPVVPGERGDTLDAMIELRTAEEIELMRPAGRFVAEVLHTLKGEVRVGTNLLEINERAHDMIRERGAESCYLDYAPSFGTGPFGYVICTSVNAAVLHGRPYDYALKDGDLLTLDFAVNVDGWVADSAISFVVGQASQDDLALIASTQEALLAGIDAARVGNRIGDIGHAIHQVAKAHGYTVNSDFGGHGVGRTMHEDPGVPNRGRPGRGPKLEPGLVIAIEPWWNRTTNKLSYGDDGWTLIGADGSRGAHSEHTIAITEGDPIVLTDRAFLEAV